MKKQLIIASAALLLGTFACKKNETSPPIQQQGLEANSSAATDEVKQKTYELDSEHTTELIKKFKGQFTNVSNVSKSNSNGNTLALDSSIWLLEAALNYDFDSPKTIEVGYNDSLKFTTPISNSTINGADFANVYSALVNLLSQKINVTTKIQVIDVSAKVDEGNIIYSLDITMFHTMNGQKVATPCDPFTSETASPSKFATVIPSYANAFLSCSGNPTLDGPSQIELKLNSCSFPACSNGYYYTNITSVTRDPFNTSAYQAYLYYRSIASAGDYCINANKILTAAQLNQYKSGCNTIAYANRPSSPAGLQILNTYDLSLEITSQICCFWPNIAYWKLKIQYGTLNCSGGGGGGS